MPFKNFPLPISAILLDLDGTLLHSAPDLAEAANRMRRDMGLAPITQDLLMSFIGNGITSLIKRSLGGRMDAEPDVALFEQAMPVFDRHYKTLLHSKPYAGVIDGLSAIKSAGYRLGCITNKSGRYTGPLLSNAGLAGYFEIVVCGDTLSEKKPHPLPLLHAAQFFGVAPERVLMIGDSRNDVLAARAAGCPVFCVPYGYNHGKPVAGLDMDAEIAALPDALKLITRV